MSTTERTGASPALRPRAAGRQGSPPAPAAADHTAAQRGAGANLGQWVAEFGVHTDQGRVRGNNEDNFLLMDLTSGSAPAGSGELALGPGGLLLAVADGMGGVKGGERASALCMETLATALGSPGPSVNGDRCAQLRAAIQRANQIIYREAAGDESSQGMGTTLTAALVVPAGGGVQLFIAQVGDSRCYLGRDHSLVQLTRDQTVWESMLDAGHPETAGADESLAQAPWKNMLMQAVGAQPGVEEAVSERALESGDWLVLCTDGLYRVVPPGDIAEVLHQGFSMEETARALVRLANQRGGPDNITTIVCRVRER